MVRGQILVKFLLVFLRKKGYIIYRFYEKTYRRKFNTARYKTSDKILTHWNQTIKSEKILKKKIIKKLNTKVAYRKCFEG